MPYGIFNFVMGAVEKVNRDFPDQCLFYELVDDCGSNFVLLPKRFQQPHHLGSESPHLVDLPDIKRTFESRRETVAISLQLF